MQKNYAKIQAAGADLIAISSDDEGATKQMVQNQGLKFLVLADPDVATISDYNVVDPFNKRIARPTTYILSQDGTIGWKFVDARLAGRVPPATVLAELDKL